MYHFIVVNTQNALAVPWLTPEIMSAIRDKQRAKEVTECSGKSEDNYSFIQTA